MYYTLDGSMPTAGSKKYTEPFVVESPGVVKAITIVDGKVAGEQVAEKKFVAK